MKKPKTHVAIVLDRSGSMWTSRDKTVEGYNEWVQQLKEDAEEQDITCSLVTFNGNVHEHLWKEDAKNLEESTVESYNPSGSTAFFDAVGYVIDKMTAEDDGDENTAYLLKVISDGDENDSSHYKEKVITEIFEGARASKRWTFDFMGCSEKDLKKINKYTGVSLNSMAMWSQDSDEQTSQAFAANKHCTRQYFAARAAGSKSEEGFHASYCQGYAPADYTELADSYEASAPKSRPSAPKSPVFAKSSQAMKKGYKRPV